MLRSLKPNPNVPAVLVAVAVVALACSDSTDPNGRVHVTPDTRGYGRVTSVQIKTPPPSVEEGSRTSLACIAMDSRGLILDASKSWRVSDTSVAAVSAAGLFVARREGNSLVTCAADGVSSTAAIAVTSSPIDFIDVSPGGSELMIGGAVQLTAVARDATGDPVSGHPVQWSSDNTTVATVSASGAVTASGEGSATITATSGSKAGAATLSVSSSPPAPVASIKLSIIDPTLNIGQSTHVDAVLSDAAGHPLKNRSIVWSVGDPSIVNVATRDANTATVIAKLTGTTQIVASSEGVSASVSVTVAPPAVQSITVTLANPMLYPQQTTQAVATLKDANSNLLSDRAVTWKSLNTAIAVVSASGLVTALSAGTVGIRASSEGKNGDATLLVQVPTVTTVGNVTVALSSTTITQGQQSQAYAVVTDANGAVLNGQTVTWASTDESVATVSSSGLVTGKAAGTAKIRATVQSKMGEATETVMAPTQPVATVAVSLASSNLTVGQTTQATATPKDLNGFTLTGRTVTWSSLNPSVATVSSNGVVTAVSVGTAGVRATVETVTGDASAGVSAVPIANIAVSLASSSVTAGQITQATAVATDANGNTLTGRTMTWSSSNPAVATVSASGVVTAVAGGTANIRASAENRFGEAQLSVGTAAPVVTPVATVTVTLAAPGLSVGQTTQASAIARDASSNVLTGRVVAWSSLNSSVATVSSSGLVTALASGSAAIRATVETKTGDATATVTGAAVYSVAVSLPTQHLAAGQSIQASAIVRDAAGNTLTGRTVAWSSENASIATVSSTGVVTAVSAGTGTIWATVESVKGDANVTVSGTSSGSTGTAAVVAVSLAESALSTGQTTQATAEIRDASGNVLTGKTVAWVSLNPSIATVSAAGLVTAVTAGSTSIQATVDSKSGSAPLTVSVPNTAPVATVSVTLGSPSLYTGQTTQATAVARDASGAVLTGRPVSWTSSNPAVASVSAVGTVTALTAGTVSIQATVETKVGSAPLGVTSAPTFVPSSNHPNEPAGMTVLHTHDASALMPTGWFNAVGQISIVSDPEKGNALQLSMQGSTTPGSGTARIDTYPEIGSFGATKIYIAFWQKLSPQFKGNNGSGSLKNLIVHSQATYGGLPNGAFHLPGLLNNPANPDGRIRPIVSLVNMTEHDGIALSAINNITYYVPDQGEPGDPGDVFSRGVWHFIEAVYEFGSKGQANGTVTVWIDGKKITPGSKSELAVNGLIGGGIKPAYDGTLRFTGLEITNVWGGGGTVITGVDNYYRFKDVYVSGGFARPGERPDHWVITAQEGTSVTAGSDVHLVAQLVDANGNPVDVCGLQPKLTVTGGATWDYWNGAGLFDNYTACEHGRQLYTLHTSRTVGTQHVVTVEDYGTVNNGAAGDRRAGTLTISVR